MRLTLRTLLAYLDDSLKDPQARAEIQQKLQDSEYAQGLVQRITEVTHRMRMATPKLHGKGLGADANTVAEYLDNTMHNERVTDFEKVALESDAHLAEVADCHQILALVLGQPAEVDPVLRSKMYDIVHQAHTVPAGPHSVPAGPHSVPAGPHTEHAATSKSPVASNNGQAKTTAKTTVAASAAVAATTASAHDHERERPVVPEYLRSSSSASSPFPRWAWGAIAAALLLGVMRLLGPFDGTHPVAQLVAGKPNQQVAVNNNPTNNSNPSTPIVPAVPSTQPPVTSQVAPMTSPAVPANPTANAGVAPAPMNPATSVVPANPMPPVIPATTAPVDPAAKVAPVIPAPVAPGDGNAATSANNGAAPNNAVASNTITPPPMPTEAAPQPTPMQGVVGRMSQDLSQVLLNFKTAPGSSWQRLGPADTIQAGERLLGLHPYRPTITLKNGVSLILVGETQLETYPTDNPDVLRIRLHFGRIVLINAGKANTVLLVEPGVNKAGTVTLIDPDSSAAIEVVRDLVPGTNPETSSALVNSQLYAAQGRTSWQLDAQSELNNLKKPDHLNLFGAAAMLNPLVPNEARVELPGWIMKSDLSSNDNLGILGSAPFNQILSQSKQPLSTTFNEIVANNRTKVEVKYLATRALALTDDFDSFVSSLSDPDQKAVWQREIEVLQSALARGPETAALVRQAIVKNRPEYGAKLYRYLWGVARQDLANGLGDELIEGLQSDALDMRVVSYYALRDAVKETRNGASTSPTLNYSPDATLAVRQPAVQRWQTYVRDLVKKFPATPAGAQPQPKSLE